MSRLRHYATLLVAALAIIGLVSFSSAGVGAAPPSETFDEPGSHSFVVPEGVTSLTVDAYGAAGGSGAVSPIVAGGLGGRTTATISVTPGETLQINVGGVGESYAGGGPGAGGTNGGANGGGVGAGGGGGASDVRRGSDLSDRLVVAGGGGAGGGGSNSCESGDGGAGGGAAPTAGSSINGAGGGEPGGSAAGGAGGAAGMMGSAGADGSFGAGGVGAPGMMGYAAGGGGGGWYGGGGGGSGMLSAGGGGGSAFVVEGATGVAHENGSRAGDGLVVLTWTESEPTTTTTAAPTTAAPTTAPPTTAPPASDAPVTPTPQPAGGPSAKYGATPGSGTTQLTAAGGGSLIINSDGWAPGAPVTVTMYSTPTELGRVAADATGAFVQTFTVPATAAVGEHRIELTGVAADGSFATVSLGLEVTATSATPTAPPASLAFTC